MALALLFSGKNLNNIVNRQVTELEEQNKTRLKLSDQEEINNLVSDIFKRSFESNKYTGKIYTLFKTSVTKAIESSIEGNIRTSEIVIIANLFKFKACEKNLSTKNEHLNVLTENISKSKEEITSINKKNNDLYEDYKTKLLSILSDTDSKLQKLYRSYNKNNNSELSNSELSNSELSNSELSNSELSNSELSNSELSNEFLQFLKKINPNSDKVNELINIKENIDSNKKDIENIQDESGKCEDEIKIVEREIETLETEKRKDCYNEKEINTVIASNKVKNITFKILLKNKAVSFNKENQVIINKKNVAKAAENFTKTTGAKSVETLSRQETLLQENLKGYVQTARLNIANQNDAYNNPERCSSDQLSLFKKIKSGEIDKGELKKLFACDFKKRFLSEISPFLLTKIDPSGESEKIYGEFIYEVLNSIAKASGKGKFMTESGISESGSPLPLRSLVKRIKNEKEFAKKDLGLCLSAREQTIIEEFLTLFTDDRIDEIRAYFNMNGKTSNYIINLIGEKFPAKLIEPKKEKKSKTNLPKNKSVLIKGTPQKTQQGVVQESLAKNVKQDDQPFSITETDGCIVKQLGEA